METKGTIRISCEGSEKVKLSELDIIQGNLKTMSEAAYEKLKNSILRHGFSFPVFLWRDPESGRLKIIDGTQRVRALRRMIREGYMLERDEIPAAMIEAKDKKEALSKILAAISEYGKYSKKTVSDFIELSKLDFSELKDGLSLKVDIDPKAIEEEEPEVQWSEELLERHDFILLYYDNEVDWVQAKELFGIQSKWSREKFAKRGIGRVIRGAEAIRRLKERWGVSDES